MWMRFLGCALLATLLFGCQGGAGLDTSVQRNPVTFAQPDAPLPAQISQEYRIGPFDELKITVFQVTDLTSTITVDSTGRINLPLVGEVVVGGQTPREVTSHLVKLYGPPLLQHPEVSVSVEKAVNQRVTIDGAVNQPGLYPITGATTLLQAISLAHGARDDAVLSRVVIFRRIESKRQAAAFDLRQIRRGAMSDPEIYGDDVVVVDGSNVRKNMRDILSAIPVIAIFSGL